jgi:hypothetical protein
LADYCLPIASLLPYPNSRTNENGPAAELSKCASVAQLKAECRERIKENTSLHRRLARSSVFGAERLKQIVDVEGKHGEIFSDAAVLD